MTRHLAPSALVILSGLLTHQAGPVIAAYRARGLMPVRHLRIEGWSSLLLRKAGGRGINERWRHPRSPHQNAPPARCRRGVGARSASGSDGLYSGGLYRAMTPFSSSSRAARLMRASTKRSRIWTITPRCFFSMVGIGPRRTGGKIFSNVKAGIVHPLFVELRHSWISPGHRRMNDLLSKPFRPV